MKSTTLIVGGATWGHFVRFLLFLGASIMCTHCFPNFIGSSCAQLSPCPKVKNITQLRHHMWKILAPKFKQRNGTTYWNNQCQPNMEFYMLGVCGFCLLFWSTWKWAPPYTNRCISIYVDCHLVGHKPSRILGGDVVTHFGVLWALKG